MTLGEFGKGLLGALGLDILAIGIVDKIKGELHAKGISAIHAGFFGVGLNDEVLFAKACSYANRKLGVTIPQLVRLIEIINSYEIAARKMIVRFIGNGEEAIPAEKLEANTEGAKGKKKEKKKAPAVKAAVDNVAGAHILLMLSQMSDSEVRLYLETAGATDTFAKKFGRTVKVAKEIYNRPEVQVVTERLKEVRDDYHEMLDEPTILERVGNKGLFKKFRLF